MASKMVPHFRLQPERRVESISPPPSLHNRHHHQVSFFVTTTMSSSSSPQNQTCSQKFNADIRHSNFYLNKGHIQGNNNIIFCFMRKAEKPKIGLKADFSDKKRTNLRAYFPKGLIIRPKYDKTDLLGRTTIPSSSSPPPSLHNRHHHRV